MYVCRPLPQNYSKNIISSTVYIISLLLLVQYYDHDYEYVPIYVSTTTRYPVQYIPVGVISYVPLK
jgi:hypothetical protein